MSTRLNYMYTFFLPKINKHTLIYSMDIDFVPNGCSNSDGGFTTLEWKI